MRTNQTPLQSLRHHVTGAIERGETTAIEAVTGEGNAPRVGQTYKVYGQTCRIVKVYAFGTMDVETLDGSRAYRVTGLPFLKQPIDSFGQTANLHYSRA